jgi:hypothetical protein
MRTISILSVLLSLGLMTTVPAAAAPNEVAPDLGAYVGKYVVDKVEGVSFLDHPLVRAAIEAAAPQGPVRDQMYVTDAVTTPVIKVGQRLYVRSYDPASGGDVNWGILIALDGSKAALCYSEGVEPDVRGADWYAEGEKAFTLFLMCPSEAGEIEETLGDWPIGPIPG